MRTIEVTTDVYAAIWATRRPGEDSEDAILARILNAQPAKPTKSERSETVGFRDSRFDISFPEGFEIFRTYKGTEFRAKATGSQWHLINTGASYNTLNQLSRATSGNIENAWRNWYFMGSDGQRHLVEGLRNDVTPNVRHLAFK